MVVKNAAKTIIINKTTHIAFALLFETFCNEPSLLKNLVL